MYIENVVSQRVKLENENSNFREKGLKIWQSKTADNRGSDTVEIAFCFMPISSFEAEL